MFVFFLTLNPFLSQTINRIFKTWAAAGIVHAMLRRESLESPDLLPAKRFERFQRDRRFW